MPKQAKPVHGRASIDGDWLIVTRCFESGTPQTRRYRYQKLTDHPAVPGPCFSLTVDDEGIAEWPACPNGTVYTVARTEHGIECTCADWTYRRQNDAEPCKHGKALIAVGKMPRATNGR